jgi:cardiolipin synthase
LKQFLKAENIELVHSGNNYFELLEDLIDRSKDTIQFQTYIFDTDETGMRIVNALKRAAARKVDIWLMVDAFGSNAFSHEIIKELKDRGIHFRKFSPLFSNESIYFGRRLHYKIIVCDKQKALTGGINIANKYSDASDEKPWLDYAILTNGEVCEYLHILCENAYTKKSGRTLRLWEASAKASDTSSKAVSFKLNDWIKGKNEIYKSYIQQIKKAERSITIISSYFLPAAVFRKHLVAAVKRGVDVKIILAGKSDVTSVRLAENYMYAFYLRNKIKIYEWTNSVMHGKAMIIDDNWATIGSYNINFLSRYISIELNTDVSDKEFVSEFSKHINAIITNGCNFVDPKAFKEKSNIFYKLKIWFAYNFYRLIMDIVVNKRGRKGKK